ncbi:MAG: hypothetical protein PHO92_04635 [Candidatus Peribacteraceae bacterium]|nr:hypothetical protein [Candidatus Peribacteraceae bacterium]
MDTILQETDSPQHIRFLSRTFLQAPAVGINHCPLLLRERFAALQHRLIHRRVLIQCSKSLFETLNIRAIFRERFKKTFRSNFHCPHALKQQSLLAQRLDMPTKCMRESHISGKVGG